MKIDWHPYPEEFPPKNDRYLITKPSDFEDRGNYVTVAFWDGDCEYWHTRSYLEPIAWAELPEPLTYSEENDDL